MNICLWKKKRYGGASQGIWFLFGFSSVNMKPYTTHAENVSRVTHQFIIIWNDLRMCNQIMAERSMSFSLSKYNVIMWCARVFISWTSDANENKHSHSAYFSHTNLKRLKKEITIEAGGRMSENEWGHITVSMWENSSNNNFIIFWTWKIWWELTITLGFNEIVKAEMMTHRGDSITKCVGVNVKRDWEGNDDMDMDVNVDSKCHCHKMHVAFHRTRFLCQTNGKSHLISSHLHSNRFPLCQWVYSDS